MYVYNVSFAILIDSSFNGEQACENHEYNETECSSIGCCQWEQKDNQCWSAVGQLSCSMVRTLYLLSHILFLTSSLHPSICPSLFLSHSLSLSLSPFLFSFVACVFFLFFSTSNLIPRAQLQLPLFLSSFLSNSLSFRLSRFTMSEIFTRFWHRLYLDFPCSPSLSVNFIFLSR